MNKINYRRSVQQIPHLIRRILLGESGVFPDFGDIMSNKVLFILIDSLAYNLFTHYMWDLKDRGYLTKIYSVFPSTTAAALTSIYTGLSPKEHGILEWYMYYEEVGDVIKTLPFSTRGALENDEILKRGMATDSLFELPALTSYLRERELKSCGFIKENYAYSAYSRHMFSGADIVPYSTYIGAFNRLENMDCNLSILYIDSVDALSHRHGPTSSEVYLEVLRIKREIKNIMKKLRDTVLIIAADHGQVDFKRIQIKREIICNEKILPGGSPRDVFLYCDSPPEMGLSHTLLSREDVIKHNLLGDGNMHPHLNERLPNYILLPDDHEGIWFEKIDMKGGHGGLSSIEIEVPLFIAEL